MMRQSLGVLAMMLGFATVPEAIGQAPSAYKARLDAIVKRRRKRINGTSRSSIRSRDRPPTITWPP